MVDAQPGRGDYLFRPQSGWSPNVASAAAVYEMSNFVSCRKASSVVTRDAECWTAVQRGDSWLSRSGVTELLVSIPPFRGHGCRGAEGAVWTLVKFIKSLESSLLYSPPPCNPEEKRLSETSHLEAV